jgi:hypothetical protein
VHAPNLTLIERLWRFLKKGVLHKQYYEKFSDFRSTILNVFKNIKRDKDEQKSLMILKFHTLGAEGLLVFYGATWQAKIALAQLFSFIFCQK